MKGRRADTMTTAHRVLTQRELLALIASFQCGVPGVVAPLLRRLVTDGFVRCHIREGVSNRPEGWRHVISTPIYARVRPLAMWAERLTPEAIARCDTPDLHALHTILTSMAFTGMPTHTTQRLLHRTAEAAAACGRVDMLRWLHEERAVFSTQPQLVPFCVKLATCHGQVAVLEWLDKTLSTDALSALDVLVGYTLLDVVRRGHLAMVRWLAARKLGVMTVGCAFDAVAQRNIEMLREVLAFPADVDSTVVRVATPGHIRVGDGNGVDLDPQQSMALTKWALHHRQFDAVRCIIDHGAAFPVKLLRVAIERHDEQTIDSVVANFRNVCRRNSLREGWSHIVYDLVNHDDARTLERIARIAQPLMQDRLPGVALMWGCRLGASDATMRALLRMSLLSEIATVVMMHALRGEMKSAEQILALVDLPLPPDVLGFVDRACTGTLGPLASLARTDVYWEKVWLRRSDAHIMETTVHWLPSASRQDARDAVLCAVCGGSYGRLARTLAADVDHAHFDDAFLALCRSLHPTLAVVMQYENERTLRQRAADTALHYSPAAEAGL